MLRFKTEWRCVCLFPTQGRRYTTPVERSEVDGYIVQRGPGTIVQFNIPPKKVQGLNLVSLKYKVARLHRQGFDQDSDWDFTSD